MKKKYLLLVQVQDNNLEPGIMILPEECIDRLTPTTINYTLLDGPIGESGSADYSTALWLECEESELTVSQPKEEDYRED